MKIEYIERTIIDQFRQIHDVRTILCHHVSQIGGLTYCYTTEGYVKKVIPTEDIAENYFKRHSA